MAPTVVSASIGVLGPLVVKLSGLLAGEYGRLKGVRKEILALNLELSTMHAAVQKYAMLEDPDIQVKQWVSMVRELAYDIEDCIDKFIHRLGKDGRHGGFKESFRRIACSLKTVRARRGIAGQIEELKARIKHVKELKNSYKLDDPTFSTSNHRAIDPRLSALFAEQAHLVGIDGLRDDIVKWMDEKANKTTTKHRIVLSIVGFGGLGKTTLANQVYHKIEEDFDCRAFVSVSQKPNINRIIKDVINQVSCQDGFRERTMDDWGEMKSITKLRELLQDKRYLILIDDIWSTQAWENIKCAFPENNCSSRIIATTRIMDIAKSCCSGPDDRIHEMEALSDLHSRTLFFNRIFGSIDHCPDMLKEVSSKVLKKCGGLPLAIISLSGLLANKPVVRGEWEKVKSSIGPALENNRSLEGMNSILSLSYNDLPPNLKTCMLYLCVFPEDYVIDRERLVRRWIAEGFISEERGKSQYEVAETYFYELLNKSMVQSLSVDSDGRVHACRVHDMMLEIIISKSAEDNFITVVGGGQKSLLNHHGIIRRLSIHHIDNELALALANEDLSHVRSLMVTTSGCIKHLPHLVKFEGLRVLDFEGCDGLEKYDMNGMDKLFRLRYLSFKGTYISKLPAQIVKLSELETLDFRDTRVEELPTGFVRLTKLQHLLSGRRIKIPSGIGIMSNLRVIDNFNATLSPADALEELGNLTNLSELSVFLGRQRSEYGGPDTYKSHEEKLFSSLHKLIGRCKLKQLHIYGDDGHSLELLESWPPMQSSLEWFNMNMDYYFRNVPKWFAPALTSLTTLHINLTELTEDGLHSLGELPSLHVLGLTLEIGGSVIKVQGVGFRSLDFLEILSRRGTNVTFANGAMPRLEYFKLDLAESVGRNYGFYSGFVHLPCLSQVDITIRSEGATNSETIAAINSAIKEEVGAHTNHPWIDIDWTGIKDNGKAGNVEEKSKEDGDTQGN